jgi:hypothetical protein
MYYLLKKFSSADGLYMLLVVSAYYNIEADKTCSLCEIKESYDVIDSNILVDLGNINHPDVIVQTYKKGKKLLDISYDECLVSSDTLDVIKLYIQLNYTEDTHGHIEC